LRQRPDDPARAFLLSVREVRAERRQLERRLAQLRSEAERITASYGKGAPGGGGDPHKDGLLAELADRSAALDEAVRACWRREDLADEFIHLLPDYRQRAVLRLRYIECLRWPKLTEALTQVGLYYEDRQVFRLHGAALQEARAVWPRWVEKHPELQEDRHHVDR
jgi:transposase